MARTHLITGAASGIGLATRQLLEGRGDRVIGADLHDTDIVADLGSADGRAHLVAEATRLADGRLDAIHAVAGLAHPVAATVAINYFGTLATLDGLRPLLAGSSAPRAVAVASMASILPSDDTLVGLLTQGDETEALAYAEVLAKDPATTGQLIYSSTKKALAQWIRRQAPTEAWAGAGIPLNAVAPGIIDTPMVADFVATAEARTAILQMVPMPLNGIADPLVVARLLAWLTSEENTHLCGQVVFVDGGSDAVIRGDATW